MSAKIKEPEIDPIWHMMPADQIDRVLNQDMCDVDPTFLGFTEIYEHLAAIIPLHWTVVDLGCAFSPQAILFKEHRAYVGVDFGTKERFSAPNTVHHEMTIAEFIAQHGGSFDKATTFAICSYVPPWHDDNRRLARESFENVFVYYPAGGPMIEEYATFIKKAGRCR